MAYRWGNNGNSDRLFSWAPKSLWTVTAGMKLRHLLLGRKADKPSQRMKEQRHYFANRVHLVKAMVFPVVMMDVRAGL